MTYLAWIL